MTDHIKPGQAYQYQHSGAWIVAKPVTVEGILVTSPIVGKKDATAYLFHDRLSGRFHWKEAHEVAEYPATPIEQPSEKVEVKA